MSKRLIIPEQTKKDQARAADPAHSVWVSANAGSGKTHVLSRRVIRLLLDGVDPSRILCLTYTRAAAANMVNKVFGDLGKWAVMDEAALVGEITELEGRKPGASRVALARQLFARALETPGGLKIQTIHAFCEAVLHQFPLEANIAGHFEMLDAQMEQALVGEARRELISGAGGEHDPDLASAFDLVISTAGESGLNDLLSEIVANREGLRGFLLAVGGTGEQLSLLKEEFGIEPGETRESSAASVWPDSFFTERFVHGFQSAALGVDAKAAIAFAEKFLAASRLRDPETRIEQLGQAFLTTSGTVRSGTTIAAKGLKDRFPDFTGEFERCAGAILAVRDRIATLELVEATDAALTVADRLIARYERLKSARGFLDFNDLITRTVNLLARADAGPWVQYKLDRGLDHILVDEAQDTSPGQWAVIRRLADEFFSGLAARSDARRTVFAVGDEKQSIYSFQGAEPAAFAESGHAFSGRIAAARQQFNTVRLNYSFRSVGDVLSAVDEVFSADEARRGLTVLPEKIEHSPIRANDPGYVEIWPMIGAQKSDPPEDWTEAIDHASLPAVRLAEAIARHISDWIASGEVIEGTGRKLKPGDVMVLVRKRDSFVHALSRALKNLKVRVAGADRLRLRDHIAVKDLLAIGRFVIQSNDDLSLAALLKSPIFRFSDDDLYKIAHGRGEGISLWQSLRNAAETKPVFAGAAAMLTEWQREAAMKPAVEFFSSILARDGVRAAMIGRLGHEAGEIMDEFVNHLLASERAGISGMGAFIETLETASPEIKREIDQSRDEVRIMTVHAAKGLEAPVVFLVDNGADPFSHQHLPRLMPFEPRTMAGASKGYLWRSGAKTEFLGTLEAAQRQKAEEEYRRLLYVGMTRAEDRLLVCGYHGVRGPKDGIWHQLVSAALAGDAKPAGHSPVGIDGDVLRYRSTNAPPQAVKDGDEAGSEPAVAFPANLRAPLPPEVSLPRPFAPSGAAALVDSGPETVSGGTSPVLGQTAVPGHAIERGIVIHRLLQVLPQLDEDAREPAAIRYLERRAAGWDEAQRLDALKSVTSILTDPRFASVFASGSRAEVEVAGHLQVAGAVRAVAGKIDRIAVTQSQVLIVDYKTNRAPPRALHQIPQGYVAQIAAYAALVRQIYPDREVRAGLLFTEIPELFDIPETVMDEALERLAVS